MKLVFMGTPAFAVPSLKAIAKEHEVELVVTRPDAVRGRGKKLVASEVKLCAEELGLPVAEAKRMSPELLETIRGISPDVIVVAAYGCILPDELLAIPTLDCINVHASLLPKLRGAAPIQRAVLEGSKRAGVSIMRVVTELDAGPFCKQASLPIGEMSCPDLMAALAELGAETLVDALAEIDAGTASWQEQDAAEVTFAPKITKEEMLLRPEDSAKANALRVQASMDAAPAKAEVAGRSMRIYKARVNTEMTLKEGQVSADKHAIYLGCSDGVLELLRIKPDGKKEMDAHAFAQGLRGDLSWSALS